MPRFLPAVPALVVVAALALIPVLPNPASSWTQTDFMLGAAWGPRLTMWSVPFDSVEFRKAKDAYFNHVAMVRSYPKRNGYPDCRIFPLREEANRSLAVNLTNSLKSFVEHWGFYDSGLFFTGGTYTLSGAGEDSLEAIVDDYEDGVYASAVGGYFYKDEPPDSSLLVGGKTPDPLFHRRVGKLVEHMKTISNLPTTIGFFPVYAFTTSGHTKSDYEKYLDRYLTERPSNEALELVTYNHYPFNYGDTLYTRSYFYNLRTIRSKSGSRPFWAAVLAGDYGGYSQPTEAEIRFCTLSSIAYGAKGISYFPYGEPENLSCYTAFATAIMDECGAPTSTYDIVKELNYYISNLLGPKVMSTSYLGGYHQNARSQLGENLPTSERIPNADVIVVTELARKSGPGSTTPDTTLLVGLWDDAVNECVYGVVLNQSTSATSESIRVKVQGDYRGRVTVGPQLDGYAGSTTFSAVSSTYASVQTTFVLGTLGPGDARMFSVSYAEIGPGPQRSGGDSEIEHVGPVEGGFEVRFGGPETVPLVLQVYDVQGRRLRRITAHSRGSGANRLTWDGRDEAGAKAAPGVYLYRASAGPREKEGKFIVLK